MNCPGHLCTCKHFLFGMYKEFQMEIGIYPRPTYPTRAFWGPKTVPGATGEAAKKDPSRSRGTGSPILVGKELGIQIKGHQSPGSAGGFLWRPGRSQTPELKKINLDKQWQVKWLALLTRKTGFSLGKVNGSMSQLLRITWTCGRTKNECPHSTDKRLINHLLCARHILSKELIRRQLSARHSHIQFTKLQNLLSAWPSAVLPPW